MLFRLSHELSDLAKGPDLNHEYFSDCLQPKRSLALESQCKILGNSIVQTSKSGGLSLRSYENIKKWNLIETSLPTADELALQAAKRIGSWSSHTILQISNFI